MRDKVLRMLLNREADAVLVLENHKTGETRVIPGKNIITNAGDVYYAQRGAAESPTNAFANLYLATGGPNPTTKDDNYGSFTGVTGEKAPSAGYPQTDDDDGDNTGAGTDVISWRYEYATGDGPFVDITHSFIAAAGAEGTDPILNSYRWSESWDKDGNTSAKIFANHTVAGS